MKKSIFLTVGSICLLIVGGLLFTGCPEAGIKTQAVAQPQKEPVKIDFTTYAPVIQSGKGAGSGAAIIGTPTETSYTFKQNYTNSIVVFSVPVSKFTQSHTYKGEPLVYTFKDFTTVSFDITPSGTGADYKKVGVFATSSAAAYLSLADDAAYYALAINSNATADAAGPELKLDAKMSVSFPLNATKTAAFTSGNIVFCIFSPASATAEYTIENVVFK